MVMMMALQAVLDWLAAKVDSVRSNAKKVAANRGDAFNKPD